MASDTIAYCGLYCGACSFRIAAEAGDRSHIEAMPPVYDAVKALPLERCPGCRRENLCTAGSPCAIRECARGRGIEHCGECDAFPCRLLRAFASDGKPHHGQAIRNLEELAKLGEPAWLALMKKRWTCPACGAPQSWYLRTCQSCGRRLDGSEAQQGIQGS